jgi:hypothetical protein
LEKKEKGENLQIQGGFNLSHDKINRLRIVASAELFFPPRMPATQALHAVEHRHQRLSIGDGGRTSNFNSFVTFKVALQQTKVITLLINDSAYLF